MNNSWITSINKEKDLLVLIYKEPKRKIYQWILKNLQYEERLKRLYVFLRDSGGAMFEVFKMIHGNDKVNLKTFFLWMRTEKQANIVYTKKLKGI